MIYGKVEIGPGQHRTHESVLGLGAACKTLVRSSSLQVAPTKRWQENRKRFTKTQTRIAGGQVDKRFNGAPKEGTILIQKKN